MENGFFAFLSRMKYIKRWGLMRNSRSESLSEHSAETAFIAHALCIIGNRYFGKNLNADRAAVLALYHDVSESMTGDMPTPVKYYSSEFRAAHAAVEKVAKERLLSMLPKEMALDYTDVINEECDDDYLKRLVKAADTVSAYVKCVEERLAGNGDFLKAEASILKKIKSYGLPEADKFIADFLPAYEKTVDEF